MNHPPVDRKALARAYRESRRPMGVYCVRNRLLAEGRGSYSRRPIERQS